MQSQEHAFELPSCIEQEVQFCSFGSFFNCYSSVPVVIPCEFISLKHILDKFRLYIFLNVDLLLRRLNQQYFRKC